MLQNRDSRACKPTAEKFGFIQGRFGEAEAGDFHQAPGLLSHPPESPPVPVTWTKLQGSVRLSPASSAWRSAAASPEARVWRRARALAQISGAPMMRRRRRARVTPV